MSLFTVSMRRLRVYSLRSGSSLVAFSLLLQAMFQAAFSAECIPLRKVEFETTEISSQSDLAGLTQAFLGACIDGELIRTILAELSNDLIERGYVTSRPYLLEQNISDGQIEIRILVGRIESIIDADSGAHDGKIATAFLFGGDVLNLRDLETSLEMIERITSISAGFEIKPGIEQGGSIVEIKIDESNPFRTELGVNAQTDIDAQLSFLAALDNPFNINDIIEFRYNSGEVFRSFQSNRSRELIYSFPLGSYLLMLKHSDIRYKQRVQGINGSFLSEGDTVSDEFGVSKLLTRSQTHKLSLALALELKDSRSFLDTELIEVSSYKTSQLRLELLHQWFRSWGRIATSYGYHRGLDSYGARDDDYFTIEDGFETGARLQFEKFVVDSQLYYFLPDPDWYTSFRLKLQYSDDLLFDNDRLYVGSPYTVRGYSSALSGSNAWYLRSDLTRRFQSVVNPFSGNPLTKAISLSAGIDFGEVKCEVDNRDVCGEIYGLGLGVELSDANFHGRIQWGHPLKKPGNEIGDEDILLLDLRWAL